MRPRQLLLWAGFVKDGPEPCKVYHELLIRGTLTSSMALLWLSGR